MALILVWLWSRVNLNAVDNGFKHFDFALNRGFFVDHENGVVDGNGVQVNSSLFVVELLHELAIRFWLAQLRYLDHVFDAEHALHHDLRAALLQVYACNGVSRD